MSDTMSVALPAGGIKEKAKQATGAAVFGTFIEYYDFSVYGYVAATLSLVFFPAGDAVANLLNTLAVFGLAFLVRPIGAWYFGQLGDRRGRRTSLIASITLMGVASALTGLLPSYQTIGIVAPVLLVLMRLLQGFSTGGEIGGAASYIREWAAPDRRALYISFLPSVAQLGKGLAAALGGLMAAMLTRESMIEWGWRIPFLLAGPLAVLTIWMRLSIEDSPEFAALSASHKTTKAPLASLFQQYPTALAKVMLISAVQNIGTYIGTVFVSVYFSEVLGFSKAEAATVVLLAVILASFLIPLAGMIGNRVGGKTLLLIAYTAYLLLTLPEFMLMNQNNIVLALLGLSIGIIPYALCQAGTYATMPEMFPTQIRHTGVAFGHSVGAVVGGGGGPYFAAWLISVTGNTYMPAYILMGAGLVGLVVVGLTVRRNVGGTHLYA
ncbi:MFS transporter [Methylobacterium sp. WSM2598]|uniref:MFS transporter n=1 Tax=Methylobacterium sp. WSM2598 TaxID=398261 RepID=UPI000476D296|nr:MFS transporter [Methylobacterium sp. WSM2598]